MGVQLLFQASNQLARFFLNQKIVQLGVKKMVMYPEKKIALQLKLCKQEPKITMGYESVPLRIYRPYFLHNRIVYLGMPLVPAVTELIVAEFLYLQYENSEKPVFMYLNSTGTSNPDGTSAGFETEAFAIADTMNYIKPPVHTICVGQAFGTCAMLLSSGEPTFRSALPNATIMIHQPTSRAKGQASDIAIKAREVLYNRKQCFEIIAETSGQSLQKVMKDASRTKYLSPQEAVEYGIIDKILENPKNKSLDNPTFLSSL